MIKFKLILVSLVILSETFSQGIALTSRTSLPANSKQVIANNTATAAIQDIVFDQMVAVNVGAVYTYKAWAKSLSGPFILRIHATFYNDANTVIGDHNDLTWVLSEVFSQHSYTLPPVPVGATKVNIGFRAFRVDGGRWPTTEVSCIIDDVQLLTPVVAGIQPVHSTVGNIQVYVDKNNILNINSDTEIQAMNIYNIEGKRVLNSIFNKLDISHLKEGLYIANIHTNGTVINRKFIRTKTF